MFNLGEFINNNILWLVPIISIILTIMVTVIATPDNEHLNLKDLLNIGVNLCVSAITILIANYRSSTTAWLILFAFILILLASIVVRKLFWKRTTTYKILASIMIIILGILLCSISIQHINGLIQTLI